MTPLSINQKKLIRGLSRKKIRNQTGLFLAEGDKIVREVLNAPGGEHRWEVELLVATADWLDEMGETIAGGTETCNVTAAELQQVSSLQEPNRAMAVVKQMDYKPDLPGICSDLSIALETVQDPGNLGTIIRTADWFGLRDIVCSPDSVDIYNPKVIQASMGSFLRIRVHYENLSGFIGLAREASGCQVFATSGNGQNLYGSKLPDRGVILLGNESRGLSPELLGAADRVLSIPFHEQGMHAESLNVSTAAAVILSEFRRQAYTG